MIYSIYLYTKKPKRGESQVSVAAHELMHDEDALMVAAEMVAARNNDIDDLELIDGDDAVEYLDGLSAKGAEQICFAIKRKDNFIYGDERVYDSFMNEVPDDSNDIITEMLIDTHPGLKDVLDGYEQVRELEKTIDQLKAKVRPLFKWQVDDRTRKQVLPPELLARYEELQSETAALEAEISELEAQYEVRGYRDTVDSDGGPDIEEYTEIIDRDKEKELAPRVHALYDRVREIWRESEKINQEALRLYNDDLERRKIELDIPGFEGRRDELRNLTRAKEEKLLEEAGFTALFDEIDACGRHWKVDRTKSSILGLTDGHLTAEIVIIDNEFDPADDDHYETFYPDLDDDGEYGYVDDDAVFDYFDDFIIGDYIGTDTDPAEVELKDGSVAKFEITLDSAYVVDAPELSVDSTPATGLYGNPEDYDPGDWELNATGGENMHTVVEILATRIE